MSKVIRLDEETKQMLDTIRDVHKEYYKNIPELKKIFDEYSDSKLIKIILYQALENMKGEK